MTSSPRPVIVIWDLLSILPHYGWKEFGRENKQGVEGSGNEHFTQGAKRHSTSNVT